MKLHLHNKWLVSAALLGSVILNADGMGCTPDLHVEGKYFKDPQGNIVNLHGVMDTPSMWFNSNRWTSWDLGGYVEAACPRAQAYFTKIFDAVTDTAQGAYCDIFRLHMEPSWLRKDGVTSSGEADLATTYDRNKVKTYLDKLFLPIAEDANAHGMYVIMRPPGVCPSSIQVGDDYQKYLLDVWDIVSSNETVKSHAGWLMLELANEPVQVKDANGNRPTDGTWGPANGPAKTDFFQPIINKIRANGFTGIILVPGEGYQSSYQSYATYPISDDNYGFAIHVYSGWYNQSDNNCSASSFITNMKSQVPQVDSKPIVITECDWSPGETDNTNYDGSSTGSNYGTWATAHTSTWGNALHDMMDHFGNFSITLTSTDVYVDMDTYISTGKVQPAFMDKAQPAEASGVACFKWFKEWGQEDNPACDGSSAQAPFNGTAASIPGKIEAEDYDLGGEGKGYHDTDKNNNGDAYRSDGVDIKSNDADNYSIGWMAQDEWLTYTVNIADATKYHWSMNVATENDDAQFHFQLDGKDITDKITVPNTGSYTTYQEVTGTVNLPAGEHQLTLVIDNPYFDLDWMNFSLVQEPYNGVAANIPGTIETEEFDWGGSGTAYSDTDTTNNGGEMRTEGVDIKANTDGGYRLGWTVTGEWLAYTVNVAQTGKYNWTALVSTDNDNAAFHLEMDGEAITDTVKATNTGDWDQLVEVGGSVELTQGEHVLKLVVDGNYFDIDKLTFEEDTDKAGVPTIENETNTKYTVISALGVVIGHIDTQEGDIATAMEGMNLAKGVYLLKAENGKVINFVVK